MDDQGLIDSAILLMSIGEEQAAEVFKFLAPKEVQKLGETMARLRTVDKEKVDNVLSAFAEHASSASSLVSDSDAFVRSVLNKALGEEKAGFLIDRILAGRDVSGIEGLKWMDADTIAELI
ncbi:MAG: flagellar motor switch protein FliG, partial [Betaproteobacteria bacterium]